MSLVIAGLVLSTIQSIMAIAGVAVLSAMTLPPLFRFGKTQVEKFRLPKVLGKTKRPESVAS